MAHEHGTTVVTDRSSAGLVTAVIAILLVLLMVWAIFFSGWVFDRGDNEPSQTNIQEREEGDTDVNIQQPQDTQTEAPNPGSTGY